MWNNHRQHATTAIPDKSIRLAFSQQKLGFLNTEH